MTELTCLSSDRNTYDICPHRNENTIEIPCLSCTTCNHCICNRNRPACNDCPNNDEEDVFTTKQNK